jgi:hypothetical protein
VSRALVHGTCVALGSRAALLRGGSGAGKSDLALRFTTLPTEDGYIPLLVADDQVWIERRADGQLVATAPDAIAGKLEVRGLGIVDVPFLAKARLVLACDLVGAKGVPRISPAPWEQTVIAGVSVPVIKLDPFEASAPVKLKLALLWAAPHAPN